MRAISLIIRGRVDLPATWNIQSEASPSADPMRNPAKPAFFFDHAPIILSVASPHQTNHAR